MFNMRRSSEASDSSSSASLHDRVRASLEKGFRKSLRSDEDLGAFTPDLLIHQGERVAVVEVKTGDPELPLPSSAPSQMLLLQRQAREKFSGRAHEILPVLVTNYKVSEDDEKELDGLGVKVVRIASDSQGRDSDRFTEKLATLTGFQSDLI